MSRQFTFPVREIIFIIKSLHTLHIMFSTHTQTFESFHINHTPGGINMSVVILKVAFEGKSGFGLNLGGLGTSRSNVTIGQNQHFPISLLPWAPVPDGRKAQTLFRCMCSLSSLPFGKGPGFSGWCMHSSHWLCVTCTFTNGYIESLWRALGFAVYDWSPTFAQIS